MKSDPTTPPGAAPPLFAFRNLVFGLLGLGVIAAGYAVLASGSASVAAVLLVVGYVVLIPMALLA